MVRSERQEFATEAAGRRGRPQAALPRPLAADPHQRLMIVAERARAVDVERLMTLTLIGTGVQAFGCSSSTKAIAVVPCRTFVSFDP